MPLPVTLEDIRAAAQRSGAYARHTPVLRGEVLDERAGGRVILKPECLQRTGSFKFRGACNAVFQLCDAAAKAGVVAFSSGNHAQGVAAAAALRGVPATIVMPADAPALKIARTKSHGAEIVFYDRDGEDREQIARTLATDRGAALIAPFDDPAVIAGQGTSGLELAEDVAGAGEMLDALLVPCGGGGLVAGIATAFAALSPKTEIFAVEPEGFDDTARSLASGGRERNVSASGSICDALLSPTPGEMTFAINRHLLAGAFQVSDEQVRAAMAFAFTHLKLVVEPGGAAALAALLAGRIKSAGRTTGIVLSGGNADPEMFADIVGQRS